MSTATPICERTDEQLVRTIAEWMGLKHPLGWEGGKGLWIMDEKEPRDHKAGRWFAPHADWLGASADRERVMLAMQNYDIWLKAYNHEDGTYGFDVRDTDIEFLASVVSPTLGRAFCEAVVMWIEAQSE